MRQLSRVRKTFSGHGFVTPRPSLDLRLYPAGLASQPGTNHPSQLAVRRMQQVSRKLDRLSVRRQDLIRHPSEVVLAPISRAGRSAEVLYFHR
jgi:hypothetical protein